MKSIIDLFNNYHILLWLITVMSSFVLHVIADFNLQGILADLKQKEWWKNNYPDKKYDCDWMEALIIHSLFWSIFTFIPTYIILIAGQMNGMFDNINCDAASLIITSVVINGFIHGIVDHLKANVRVISLKTDQTIHIWQIILTISLMFGTMCN